MVEPGLLPLAIQLRERRCVCIGGGALAARRVPTLLGAGALVTVIAPDLHPSLAELHAAGAFDFAPRSYQAGDLAGAFLALAATGVPTVDAAVAAEGQAAGILICSASDPAAGNCQFMATVRRGPLLVGVQTSGVAPAVSAALRARIDALLPEDLGQILEQIGALRRELRTAVPDAAERARRWQCVTASGAI
ncbi:MAG TPA: bifunctional precorrin-2 dehydrogenase/sirohydrochlorin ferrochelatase, partial [Chloroflexota bacterium]|nr:bifunctional precorrin-2 dehydrogenase/sirohydrochlorin ferrochelatase [Chloroflexota bacterium]